MPVRLDLGIAPADEAANRAALALREGKVVLLPAEGVYGYHALASRDSAVARIRTLKGDARLGFIGLIARPEDAGLMARVEPAAQKLIDAHWPGPLTLVLEAAPDCDQALRAADGTVALRCPGSAFLRAVVFGSGGVVLSSSANAPGRPAAVRLEEAPSGGVDLMVDGGTLSGVPSTIARVERGRVKVLRAGAVPIPEGSLDGPRNGP
jgi:L-threonylcarbamoyladenylate synthase